ncbi:MAG: hypothetical protein ACYTAN_10635 [Planctomycetota bacterium]|jgi:hypothetical protein
MSLPRHWWRNCVGDISNEDYRPDESICSAEELARLAALREGIDPEIAEIDALEMEISPLDEDTRRIRALISSLESCHHKAERWVENIIAAMAVGKTDKGSGTRPPGKREPIEETWRHTSVAISAWCAGCPAESVSLDIGGTPASELLALLGERTPLKEWQALRIVDKLRAFVTWPQVVADASLGYVEMVEYAEGYRGHTEYAEYYEQHRDFLDATTRTVIRDTIDGRPAEISLAVAINHLEGCNWNFLGNLQIVLAAIGGDLRPKAPFACHGRNIRLNPVREMMKTVSRSLRVFCAGAENADEGIDETILAALGDKTPVKHWLASSLDKTIRLQLGF